MQHLTPDEILSAANVANLPTQTVECPVLGGSVTLRGMTAAERDAFELSNSKNRKSGKANVRGNLLALTLVDGQGKRLFTDKQADQLANLPAHAVEPAVAAALELSGFSDDDLDTQAGNSETTSDAA